MGTGNTVVSVFAHAHSAHSQPETKNSQTTGSAEIAVPIKEFPKLLDAGMHREAFRLVQKIALGLGRKRSAADLVESLRVHLTLTPKAQLGVIHTSTAKSRLYYRLKGVQAVFALPLDEILVEFKDSATGEVVGIFIFDFRDTFGAAGCAWNFTSPVPASFTTNS